MRVFFHNWHDKYSWEVLETLPPDVQIIDVFGGDEVPGIIRLTRLPYYVDKKLTLETPPPYLVGTFVLEFACHDDQGEVIPEESNCFVLELNGVTYDVYPETGRLQVEVDCPVPRVLHLRLDGEGYWPWEGDIEVVDDA